ncbi:MAG: amidohydrolase family protein [Candidatus Bathyarchaeia archaeon]
MTHFDLILRNGRVVDPANKIDATMDIGVSNGKVAAVEPSLDPQQANMVLDLSGRVVIPGIIDPHVHIGTVGYRNMARVGVVTAVDVAAPMEQILATMKTYGTGMNIAAVTSIHHGIRKPDPSRAEIGKMLDDYLSSGSLGVKIIQEPLPHETIINTILEANRKKVYVKLDCGVTEEGSNILGFRWIVKAVGRDLHLDIAHINSYCRGQVKDAMEEAIEATRLLEGRRNIQSESYLGIINGTSGKIVNGIPVNGCTRECLRIGGYPETEEGLRKALLEGYARVNKVVGGETIQLQGVDALREWEDGQKQVSFPVNKPYVTTFLATRKDSAGKFVVDAISTDGGSSPRNVTVSSGLALVRLGALSLDEFVLKTSYAPARMYGMLSKGNLGVGADADITVLDMERGRAVMGIALGKPIMVDGVVVGTGGTVITTEKGAMTVAGAGLPYQTIEIENCGLYA